MVIRVIDELNLKPVRDLIDVGQKGIDSLTAGYVGTIAPQNIRDIDVQKMEGTESEEIQVKSCD